MTLASAVAKGCTVPLAARVETLGASAVAVAKDPFPSKPVEVIVRYPPGGASDHTARLHAQGPSAPRGRTRRLSKCVCAGRVPIGEESSE